MKSSLARLVFPALRWRAGSFAHERGRIDAALAAGVGGFNVFGGRRDAVAELTRGLRQQAGRPLLIGADLERGAAQQVEGLTELPPPAVLGYLADLDATRRAGAITGADARAVGIDWAFAPVCDLDIEPRNPIVQTRAFGADPLRVGEQAAVWIRGCQGAGVLACAKHYPGHGRTTVDSHERLPLVDAPAAELQRADGEPFEYAIRAGVGSVMTAHVAYTRWEPSPGPRAATFSPTILGYLRHTLNFGGVVVTDAFIMAGATAAQAEGPAAVTAVAAACDLLLYPTDFRAVVDALDRAVGTALPVGRADEALARYERAVGEWGKGNVGEVDLAAHGVFADGLADRATHLIRGDAPSIRTPIEIDIVDDDVGGPYTVGPRDVFRQALVEAGVPLRDGGRRVLLAYAEPRSWKGRADFGARSLDQLRRYAGRAELVVLFAHPRLVRQVPGNVPVLCCWHGQPLMQRAAARWVMGRLA